MACISLKAKVKLISESDMESWNEESMGDTQLKSAKWVWKTIGINADDIYRVISYNSTKTLVIDIYSVKILVAEPFDQVFKKWNDNKTSDLDLSDIEIDDDSEEEYGNSDEE